VAAAHWLCAAAVAAADAAGSTPDGVFVEADDIEAISVQVPTLVVEQIENADRSPREVALDLLRVAVAAAEGKVVDLSGVLAERTRRETLVERLPVDQREAALAAEPVRTTLLDPRRPARDLLEHIVDGIASCHLLYAEYTLDAYAEPGDEVVDSGGASTGGRGDSDLDGDDMDADDERHEQIAAEFADVVREQAAARRARLA
jgi:hypothetical protein